MEKIKRLVDNLSYIQRNFDMYVEEVIRDNEQIIINLNRQDQLYNKGITSTSKDISSYRPYKSLTIKIKQEKGQPTDRVTLRDRGDFYEGFYVRYFEGGFLINSTDDKTQELKDKYGQDIFGLTNENISNLLHTEIIPILIKQYKDRLGI